MGILLYVKITYNFLVISILDSRSGHPIPRGRSESRQADGGVLSAETLLEKAWDANADPFSNTTRVTISHLRKRLGEPWVIQTVPGVGYRFGD